TGTPRRTPPPTRRRRAGPFRPVERPPVAAPAIEPVPRARGTMSLETATDQIRAQLPQLAALGYKVKFVLDDGGVVFIDATETPPALSNEDAEADCTIRLSAE